MICVVSLGPATSTAATSKISPTPAPSSRTSSRRVLPRTGALKNKKPFDELKDKVANAKCLGVPRAQGEIILVTDASNVGGGGTLFQRQALEKEVFDWAISLWGTDGLN